MQHKPNLFGILQIALKMLFRDRTKYLVLLGAFTFSTLLITQQAGIFCGLMSWTGATVVNLRVPIWVMDPKVEQVNEAKPMKDTDDELVRSIPGVAWATPIFYNFIKAKLSSGDYKTIQIIGLDPTTLIGAPQTLLSGKIEDLRLPNAVMVDDLALKRYKLKMGDVIELNDKEARIVATFKAAPSFLGAPYLMTTFDRAVLFAPPTRKLTSYVLAGPQPGVDARQLAQKISSQTGLLALSEDDFFWFTVKWYFKNTGIPISFGTTILLGFLVGKAVSGQTFYAFILENLKHLATFKAMGMSNRILGKMILIQSYSVGILGYGCGLAFASLFGLMAMKNNEPPFLLPYQLVLFTFIMNLIICGFTSFLGWLKVRKMEAGVVFRG